MPERSPTHHVAAPAWPTNVIHPVNAPVSITPAASVFCVHIACSRKAPINCTSGRREQADGAASSVGWADGNEAVSARMPGCSSLMRDRLAPAGRSRPPGRTRRCWDSYCLQLPKARVPVLQLAEPRHCGALKAFCDAHAADTHVQSYSRRGAASPLDHARRTGPSPSLHFCRLQGLPTECNMVM